MSYSVCLKCREMVSMYQKYCAACEKQFKQDETFWKTHGYLESHQKDLELKKDQLDKNDFIQGRDPGDEQPDDTNSDS